MPLSSSFSPDQKFICVPLWCLLPYCLYRCPHPPPSDAGLSIPKVSAHPSPDRFPKSDVRCDFHPGKLDWKRGKKRRHKWGSKGRMHDFFGGQKCSETWAGRANFRLLWSTAPSCYMGRQGAEGLARFTSLPS